jgi:hypothetical protein
MIRGPICSRWAWLRSRSYTTYLLPSQYYFAPLLGAILCMLFSDFERKS